MILIINYKIIKMSERTPDIISKINNIINETDTVDLPYLRHIRYDESIVTAGDRKNPQLLYVTSGALDNSFLWHFEENGKFYQYRQYSVTKKTVILQCVYAKNKRANCPARITVEPLIEGLIYARKINGRNRFFIN